MKIAIAGTGYVGLSLAVLLSQKNEVVAYDIVSEKVNNINHHISPIQDEYIIQFFQDKKLNLTATVDYQVAFKDVDFIIISTPTDYNDITNQFNTQSIEDVINKALSLNPKQNIVIKSTVPVGYTEKIRQAYHTQNILFSPEFLREGKALYDNLYPSRIIVGDTTPIAHQFGETLRSCALNNPPILYMHSTEAEAVKLFANTYLAMRISFFNELDTYAELKNLSSKNIIRGICLDPRIGDYYNNPSFGYGGYCLPKDTKQLLANYHDVPQELIGATIKANQTRKSYIVNRILEQHPHIIGIYRLTMKSNSDNFRSSAIQDIIKELQKKHSDIVIYEPTLNTSTFNDFPVINNLQDFVTKCDIILANRIDDNIRQHHTKIYTRDIFEQN